jgi:hypothetical protein
VAKARSHRAHHPSTVAHTTPFAAAAKAMANVLYAPAEVKLRELDLQLTKRTGKFETIN